MRALVGYSGGPDSTCLVHLLHRCGCDIVAAHLHHGQREEADLEQSLSEAWCESLGVPFVSGKADVPQIAARFGIGLEEAGRQARYSFFEQAAGRLECNRVLTAHTSDDHVETVLLNLARGTGMAGLRGIPQERGVILRPLLGFTREETQAYCEHFGLWSHDDPANHDLSFSRARVRHRILPEFEHINPEIRRSVSRMAEIISEEDSYLDHIAAHEIRKLMVPLNGHLEFLTLREEAAFDAVGFRALGRVLGLRALRIVAEFFGAEMERSNAVRIWEGGNETLPGGSIQAQWSDSKLHFRETQVTEPFRHTVTLPGETFADSFGWQITAFYEEGHHFSRNTSNLDVALDADAINGTLYFRSSQSGERMAPLGMTEPKLISDMIQEKHLTGLARRRLPLVCDMVGPVWIPGVAIAERAKVVESTSRVLRLKFGPLQDEHDHNKQTGAPSEA